MQLPEIPGMKVKPDFKGSDYFIASTFLYEEIGRIGAKNAYKNFKHKLSKYSLILFPINYSSHWSIAAVVNLGCIDTLAKNQTVVDLNKKPA
jgi:Ulp1 family protease